MLLANGGERNPRRELSCMTIRCGNLNLTSAGVPWIEAAWVGLFAQLLHSFGIYLDLRTGIIYDDHAVEEDADEACRIHVRGSDSWLHCHDLQVPHRAALACPSRQIWWHVGNRILPDEFGVQDGRARSASPGVSLWIERLHHRRYERDILLGSACQLHASQTSNQGDEPRVMKPPKVGMQAHGSRQGLLHGISQAVKLARADPIDSHDSEVVLDIELGPTSSRAGAGGHH
mmetsp:Transcript_46084/g.107753  ORF Transcript_46084/g.107753 Transcript_46084/m.107753 type:complete len:231 (-) Transcript_46084:3302-3994(-)